MIYQPTNIVPSSFAGVGAGTVDVTDGLSVSWQINGSSAMTAYQIDIYQNDTESTLKYSTGKVELETPAFGTDYNGEQILFEARKITAETLSNAGIVNGYANGYKLLITQFWNGGSVSQTQASFFETRATPVVTIDNVANPLLYRSATFTAKYSQANDETLDFFRWYISQTDDIANPLFDSGNIYGTEDIRCQYDGFFSDTEYAVRCVVQTSSGVQADSGWISFTVQYDTESLVGYVQACRQRGTNNVLVSWPLINYINGTANGNYTLRNNQLILSDDASVTWDSVTGQPMVFRAPWSIAWRGGLSPTGGVAFAIYGMNDTLSVLVTTTALSLIYNGATVYSQKISLFPGDFFAVVLTPSHIYIRQEQKAGGLYPHVGLYPRKGLRPKSSNARVVQNYDGDCTYPQFSITSVALSGEQICDYLWIEGGTIEDDTISQIMGSADFTPSRTDNTYMLANFENGLNAGSLVTYTDNIIGLAIYRQDGENSQLRHLCDIGLNDSSIRDFGALSQKDAKYYVFPLGENTYISQPLVSDTIKPLFWDWVVLECDQDAENDDVYHVVAEYAFSNNVSTSSISNNNLPNLLTNFTRYPTRQGSSVNYKSGKLEGLIGYVGFLNGVYGYYDSTELADEILALSTSTKHKFLKNRKGDLWKIETGAPVTMTVNDAWACQAYTGAIDWVEIGDASTASVVSIPGDAFWESGGGQMRDQKRGDPNADMMYNVRIKALTVDKNGNYTASQGEAYTPVDVDVTYPDARGVFF